MSRCTIKKLLGRHINEISLDEDKISEIILFCKLIMRSTFAFNTFKHFLDLICQNQLEDNGVLCNDFQKAVRNAKSRWDLAKIIAKFIAYNKNWEQLRDVLSQLINMVIIEKTSDWFEYELDSPINNPTELLNKARKYVQKWNKENTDRPIAIKAIFFNKESSYKLMLMFYIVTGHSFRPQILSHDIITYRPLQNVSVLVLKFKEKSVEINKNPNKLNSLAIYNFLKEFFREVIEEKQEKLEESTHKLKRIAWKTIETLVSGDYQSLEEFISAKSLKEKLLDILSNLELDTNNQKTLKSIIENLKVSRIVIREIIQLEKRTVREILISGGREPKVLSSGEIWPNTFSNIIKYLKKLIRKHQDSGTSIELTLIFEKSVINQKLGGVTKILISTDGHIEFGRWLQTDNRQILELIRTLMFKLSED